METENLLEKIKLEAKKQRISVKQLAEKVGFTDTTLYNVFTMKQKLTMEMFMQLSDALNVEPNEWFEEETKNIVNDNKEKYKTKHDADCIPRHDFEFLKQQIEVLNKIILNSLHSNDDNKPTQALLSP